MDKRQDKCGNCNHTHTFFFDDDSEETLNFCSDKTCVCERYESMVVPDRISFYANNIGRTVDRVRYVLSNLGFMRNLSDKWFTLYYWQYIEGWNMWKSPLTQELSHKLTEAGALTRARRKLKELNPDLYGPFDAESINEREFKQLGIMEYMIVTK